MNLTRVTFYIDMKHHIKNLCSNDESIRKSVEKSLEGDDGITAGAEEKERKLERRIRTETLPLAKTVDPLTRSHCRRPSIGPTTHTRM